MLELPAPKKRVDLSVLNEELALLNLPDFIGTALLRRRRNEDGSWKPSDPYLLIKCGKVTATKRASIEALVSAHVAPPPPPPSPRQEAEARALAAIEANRGTPWGAVLYDLAIADGRIEA